MRRWWLGAVLLGVVGVLAWLWLRDEPAPETQVEASSVPASEGGLPVQHVESKWNAPVVARGARSVSGRVTRGGQPVAGAVVTALASHGDDVLSDLPCQCDNHCGQKLLACGCAEASGQLVELVGARTGEGAPLGRATTDAEGAFVITGLEPTQLTLWADAPGGIAWRADVASDATDVKLELSAGRRLQGKVKKTDGTAAAGALVTAIFAEQSRFFDVVADGEGAFVIGPVPNGKLAVVAMQAGLLPDHQTIRENDAEPLALELSVPRSLSGTVLRDGAPVAGATVKLDGMHRKRTVTTDAAGAFRIERLRPGKYELDAETREELAHVESTIGKSEDRTGVVITLQKGKVLSGLVTDERGAPLEGVALSVSDRSSTRRATSTADGRFTFAVTAEGQRQTLYAKKSGFLEKRVELTGNEDVRVALERSAVLSGKVLGPGGALVLEFSVNAELLRDGGFRSDDDLDAMDLEGSSASAASTDGGFALDLEPGRYTVWVEAPPFAPATLEASAPGEVVFTLEDGARLRGLVLDLDGVPAAGARVSATASGHYASPGRATTDAEGRFLIEGLAPGGWRVTADKRAESMLLWSARGEVVLQNGVATEVTLRARAGSPVAGVVISAEGEPVPKARVMAWSSSTDGGLEPGAMAMDSTDEQGHFRLRTLPPGPFTLTVDANTLGRVPAARFVAPDEKIIVRLSTATTISGRVVDPSGNVVKVFSILQRPMDTPDGRFELPARVGPMTVAIDADGFAQHIFSAEVKAGKNDLGDIKLSRGRPVTGLVLDAQTQKPVEGALIDVGDAEPKGQIFLSEERGAVRSDVNGRYRLPAVDPASTWMSVTHPDYATRNQRLGPAVTTADVALEKGGTLMVKLLDARGQPVTEARLAMVSERVGWKRFDPGFVPGTFFAKGLAPDRYTVQVQARSGATFRAREVEVTGGAQELELREATDGVTVKVEVTGAMTVLLIEGALTTPPTRFSDLAGLKRPVEVRGGVARNVLPGTWSVLGLRGGAGQGELSVHVVQITGAAEQELELTPVWRPIQME